MQYKNFVLVFLAILAISFMTAFSLAATPYGANINAGAPTTAPLDSAGSNNALAGNVTELTITGFSTTQTWQGYFGNVSGTIQLANSNDNVMYNWSLASPSGEVYSSTNQTVSWLNIQCLNFTAKGNYSAETGNGGATSQYGTNLTQLEGQFGVGASDADGVDETFTLTGAGTHDSFFTAGQQFDEGECRSTRVYDSSGTGVTNNFEEVLLYEPSTASVVYASILDNSVSGFDSRPHDFEMLVLENGHGVDTSVTPYYFFVELQ